ncbi:MAG TPA: adenylate/guanylate cyclase domain-containing protein [Acidimicrobiia bacterium]
MAEAIYSSRHELADRAGVDHEFVDRLVELGILQPERGEQFDPGDARRIAIMQALRRAGVSLEGIGRAVVNGQLSLAFVDTPAYERLGSLSDVTFAGLSEETGIDIEALMAVREASGSAAPQPFDRIRENELLVVPLLELQLSTGARPRSVARLLRVYGDSLRRIVESEASLWHSELTPSLGDGLDTAALLELADGFTPQLAALSDQALVAMYHSHQAHTWTKSIIEGVERELEAAGLHSRLEVLPAICFLDISGYTRLTEEAGDEAAAATAERLDQLVQRISIQHDGQRVKSLGDGMMFYFPSAGPAVTAALDMVEAAQRVELPPAHVGIHAGPVLFQNGDYYGNTVNIAARIADYARPGEVLVSQAVVEASLSPDLTLDEIGPVNLKGLSESVRLWAVRPVSDRGHR